MVGRSATLATLVVLCLSRLAAQDPYARITGTVADSTGALVGGARVEAIHVDTGVTTRSVSDAQGRFNIRNLVPGRYRLSVEMQGFKRSERGPFELRVGDVVTVDVTLEVGTLTETLTVTEEPPLLEAASASIGQVVDRRRVEDLPMPTSAIIYLTQLAPGVIATTPPTATWGPNEPEVNSGTVAVGTSNRSNETLVDGMPNLKSYGVIQYQPMPEVIQEFRVQTAAYDASAGHFTGAQIHFITKGGTNQFHGVLAYSYNGRPLATRPFFVNKRIYDLSTGPVTQEKIDRAFPPRHMNRYRATASGPIIIPGVYDGRNRTFWTFGYDKYLHKNTPGQTSLTVPTEAQRRGDFSALLALGSQYQIYDPATITPTSGGRTTRQPLPGNIVPTSRIVPIARKLMEYIPLPNASGGADGSGNYIGNPVNRENQRNIHFRVDHVVSQNYRLFTTLVRPREDTPWQSHSGFESDLLAGRYREQDFFGAFSNVITPRADLVAEIRLGYMRNNYKDMAEGVGYDLRAAGFPEALVSKLDQRLTTPPELSMSGYSTIPGSTGSWPRTNLYTVTGSLSYNRRGHAMRGGAEHRTNQRNIANYGYVSPGFSFDSSWTRGPMDSSPSAPIGQSFAAFLLGLPSGGYLDRIDTGAMQNRYFALYLQDDWRLGRRLTLSLGLRYELEFPTTDRYNRFNRGFDFATANPVEPAARANYARNPIAEVPVPSFRVAGGLLFAGTGGVPRGYWNGRGGYLLPRFGLAYQIGARTVVRGGYGIFLETIGPDRYYPVQQGFSQRNNMVPTLDRGVTFRATLADPFPEGIMEPPGSALGLRTYLGRSVSFFWPDLRPGYVQRWSLGIQREFPSRVLLETAYVASRGTRLAMSHNFDPIPAQYLSTLPVRDQATIDYLSAAVPNPFYGLPEFQGTSLQSATVSRSQLLRPYPHFTGISTTLDAGFSWYHALQVRAEKRLTRGFTMQVAYTWSKFMTATGKLNATDPWPEHVISSDDRPQRLVISSIYDLPFGRARRWLSSGPAWLRYLVGEWSVQGIYQGQSGPPIGFGNIIFVGDIHNIVLPRSQRKVERWFNTEAGFERDSRRQLGSNIRTFPSRLTGLRADGFNNWDLSVLKNFPISEEAKVQLRAEAQDALNHAMFSTPNTSPTSSLFGQVTSTVRGGQRLITIGARLVW